MQPLPCKLHPSDVWVLVDQHQCDQPEPTSAWLTLAKEAVLHAEGRLPLEGMQNVFKPDGLDAGL